VRIAAYPGESVATALLAAGVRVFRRTRSGAPRGPLCNMGVCFECVVAIDGESGVRACATQVREGMSVETGGPG
jgi:predicted molibdopterin-dependent oxidoreductase YjgC